MFVELPERHKVSFGEVIDSTLFFYNLFRFKEIMFELTYCIRERKCIYCGKKLDDEECTLDHGFPKSMGGVSVTNNLFPCCYNCNITKSNLTKEEFEETLELTQEKKIEYRIKVNEHNIAISKRFGYKLPRRWVTYEDIEDIRSFGIRQYIKGRKYKRLLAFYLEYGKFPEPMVIDKNNILLEGYTVFILAMEFGIKQVPVIKLDNVILVYDEKKG